MPTVEILCLANSWKPGGRCVAGLKTDGTGWVRPVSAQPTGVLQSKHYTLAWGREAALLDVLKMRLSGPQPSSHHPEDWLVDAGRWKRGRPAPSQTALAFLDQCLTVGPDLLGDTHEKIAYSQLQRHPAAESLALVRPQALSWRIRRNPAGGRPKIRALFTLAGTAYNLPLTDPVYQRRLAGLADSDHAWGHPGQEPLLTISLGEPFGQNADCYKLVAGVVELVSSGSITKFAENKEKLWRIIWDWILGRAG